MACFNNRLDFSPLYLFHSFMKIKTTYFFVHFFIFAIFLNKRRFYKYEKKTVFCAGCKIYNMVIVHRKVHIVYEKKSVRRQKNKCKWEYCSGIIARTERS